MDEKRSDLNPTDDTNQNHTETTSDEPISGDDTVEATSPEQPTDRGWAFMTQAHYDPEDPCDLTTVIISAIADAEGVGIANITDPPLYEVVDIASIDDALFGRPEANRAGTESTVEFRYNEYMVSVETDGWVTVSHRPTSSAADEQ